MADKIATREAYGSALAEFGAINENIVVLDADLAEATKTGVFKKAFSKRHCTVFNVRRHGREFALYD